MKRTILQVTHQEGLHARPLAALVTAARHFASRIRIRNCTMDSAWVSCTSILSVLTLGAQQGHVVELEIEGVDEDAALTTLSALI